MRAIAVVPGRPDTAGVVEVGEPPLSDGALLVRTRLIGICGTDREIAIDGYGIPPPGEGRLVLGHESLGEVLDAPDGSGFARGDLLAGVVRRPDPLPCAACAADEWDMCQTGDFVELGIKEHHGYGSERFRVDPRFAVRLDPALGELGVLLEPTSVVAKALEHAQQLGARAWFQPRVALITGAGPIGLLAAMLARQRGLETHVVDRATSGAKPGLVTDLGAIYHSTPVAELQIRPDIVVECTGVSGVAIDAIHRAAPGAVIALTGISHSQRVAEARLDALNAEIVLGNKVVFGTVNAARRHHDQAAHALARADPSWLARLITRRLRADEWPAALEKSRGDIKVVVDMTASD
ncbi:MAG: glucose 1-dehydrogenase [Solirubrobacterales bacterium]|nr:glucose 1-dehydrogenase [Solirubrobacterales bacterium]